MGQTHHVFLIPGFFGFANIGEPRYFVHVRNALAARASARGIDVRLYDVITGPTASLRTRAAVLLDTIAERTRGDSHPIHLVGHSTGAVDARLVLSPGITLPAMPDPEHYAPRVRSLVSVMGPHRGTPLAGAFTTLRGKQVLRLLSTSVIGLVQRGTLDTNSVQQLARVLASGADAPMLFDRVMGDLLDRQNPEYRQSLEEFFTRVGADGSLIVQLQPEPMEILDALILDRPTARIGSVIGAAPEPSRSTRVHAGWNPRRQASFAVFTQLWKRTSPIPAAPYGPLAPGQQAALNAADPLLSEPGANDGMVPTRSQVIGRVLAAAVADHMDVLGHYADPDADPPHDEWLHSATGFGQPEFDTMWDAVAAFLWDR